jgi:hypothetical protein
MFLLLRATLLLLQVLSRVRMSATAEVAVVVLDMTETMTHMAEVEAEVLNLVVVLQRFLLARMS